MELKFLSSSDPKINIIDPKLVYNEPLATKQTAYLEWGDKGTTTINGYFNKV